MDQRVLLRDQEKRPVEQFTPVPDDYLRIMAYQTVVMSMEQ